MRTLPLSVSRNIIGSFCLVFFSFFPIFQKPCINSFIYKFGEENITGANVLQMLCRRRFTVSYFFDILPRFSRIQILEFYAPSFAYFFKTFFLSRNYRKTLQPYNYNSFKTKNIFCQIPLFQNINQLKTMKVEVCKKICGKIKNFLLKNYWFQQ